MHAVLAGPRQEAVLPALSHDKSASASLAQGEGKESVYNPPAPPRHQYPMYILAFGNKAAVTRKCQGRGAPDKISYEDYDGFPVQNLGHYF